MVLNTMDWVVRNELLKRSYPLHFYLQMLLYGCEILSELHMDTLKVTTPHLLPVNSYGAVDLPNGTSDVVSVGIKVGQYVKPLIPDDSINSLNNFDSDFNIIRYDEPVTVQESDQSVIYINGWQGTTWYGFSPVNQYGEQLGRFFGFGNQGEPYTYKWIPERNQIQLNEGLSVTHVMVTVMGDGRNANAASSIESYALDTIRKYMDFQYKKNNRTYSEGEVRIAEDRYIRAHKNLRGRKSDLTIKVIRQIIYKNTRLSPNK